MSLEKKMQSIRSCKICGTIYHSTGCHLKNRCKLDGHRRENLIFQYRATMMVMMMMIIIIIIEKIPTTMLEGKLHSRDAFLV